MHQKKEKSDRTNQSNHEAILQLLPFLEGTDYEDIRNLIEEHLFETKDSRLLYGIIDYYMTVQSQRSLNILLRLKEPHDKNLFDKISELMKLDGSRYKSLQLLCNLVYKQPTWLYKIASHRVMLTLLNLLKTETNAPNLMSGLFVLVCLLPMIPSQFGPFLTDTFNIFSRLAEWNIKRPSFIVDVYMFHLDIVIYSLFHRLYGMFPCNFLAYLRSFYGGRDCPEINFKVFNSVIKPMLERVRLHPLLVTASKETELCSGRWKKMSYHDIIVDCASISLDTVEGTGESVEKKSCMTSNSFEQNVICYESSRCVSYSRQSSSSIMVESDSLPTDMVSSHELPRTPCSNLSTPIPTSSNPTSPSLPKGEFDFRSFSSQASNEDTSPPFDIAVEAKPEVLKANLEDSGSKLQSSKGTKESDKFRTVPRQSSLTDDIVLPAVEAKEDDIDKEVSELTCPHAFNEEASDEVRLDTPFCSTTQNLTADPSSGDCLDEETEGMFNSMQDTDMETDLPTFSRYRYFSHCGPPPHIPLESIQKPKVVRSSSCPAGIYPSEQGGQSFFLTSENVVVTSSSGTIANSSAFGTVAPSRLLTYEDLIPIAQNPVYDGRSVMSLGSHSVVMSSMSPPELLDRYIQQGNSACSFNQIPITSTKNTDWTHFGGKPPPDEITILRNQILLLHNQLLFERHRKDVHSERNRRILGRAKRFRMQEEHIIALKEQIKLLEQDKNNLKMDLNQQLKTEENLKIEKQQIKTDLLNKLAKAEQENSQLSFSIKNLQTLLVSQKKENDEIREICKEGQNKIQTLTDDIEFAGEDAAKCQKLLKENIYLTKQVVLFKELVTQGKEREEALKETHNPDAIIQMAYDAALFEVKDLKQKLDSKTALLDNLKCKMMDLEQVIGNMKNAEKEQRSAFEKVQSFHLDEIKTRDERLNELTRFVNQKDSHILKLETENNAVIPKKDLSPKQVNGEKGTVLTPTDHAHKFLEKSDTFKELSFKKESNMEPKSHSDEDIS